MQQRSAECVRALLRFRCRRRYLLRLSPKTTLTRSRVSPKQRLCSVHASSLQSHTGKQLAFDSWTGLDFRFSFFRFSFFCFSFLRFSFFRFSFFRFSFFRFSFFRFSERARSSDEDDSDEESDDDCEAWDLFLLWPPPE
jgi:hypothetical protein